MASPTPRSESTAPSSAHDGTTPPTRSKSSSSRWSFAITVVCDIVLPVGLYYVLRAAGAAEITALLVSGSAPALHTVHSAIRHRKLDAIGAFTIALLMVSVVASLVTADPRIALARNSLFTALAGVWLLVTLFVGRPFTYQALRTLLADRSAKLDQLWESDAAFRRVWRALTVLWGVGLLCDALIRLIMAYTLPIDTVPALDAVLYAVSWILLQIITQIILFRTHTLAKIFADRNPGRLAFGAAPEESETHD
ncbi:MULTISPECIES: VC0807 family protein [unclassified Streptomyces]|uniref:VC0807 family protein n=1 Tax=unclassified Streptomyces TaxID=2593676 RepID=UPI0034502B29